MSPVPVSIGVCGMVESAAASDSGEQSRSCGDKRDVNEFDTDIEKTSGNGQAKNIALIKPRIPVFDHWTPRRHGESASWGREVLSEQSAR